MISINYIVLFIIEHSTNHCQSQKQSLSISKSIFVYLKTIFVYLKINRCLSQNQSLSISKTIFDYLSISTGTEITKLKTEQVKLINDDEIWSNFVCELSNFVPNKCGEKIRYRYWGLRYENMARFYHIFRNLSWCATYTKM